MDDIKKVKITELPDTDSLADFDVFPVINQGTTKKTTIFNLIQNITPHLTGFLALTGGTIDGNLQISGITTLKDTLIIGNENFLTLYVDDKVGINTETPNEILTVVGNISATGNLYAVNYDPEKWSSVYSAVNSNSATNWNYQGTDLKALSGRWDSNYSTVNSNSATNWNYQGTDLKALSGRWDSNYSTVNSLSGDWVDATTVVQQGSSNWYGASGAAVEYVHNNFLPLTGGTISNDLLVNGVLSASGDLYGIHKLVVVDTNNDKIFYDLDINKVFHFDTSLSNLTAIFPSDLSDGFNIAVVNVGTNTLYLSSFSPLKAISNSITTQFDGAFVYKQNNIFAVGGL